MTAQPQNFNLFAEPAEAKLPLSVLDGGAPEDSVNSLGEAENYQGVLRVEVRESDEEGDQRIEVLTLRSGRKYTCSVTEPDFDKTPDIGGVDMTLLVPGFTEIPSASKSTASNLHREYAARHRDVRTVSVDRIGYSKYAAASSVYEVIRFARQSKEQTASDLIDIALYYAEGNTATLHGTSAGFDIDLEIVKQNGQDATRPNLTIGKKIYGAVPCVVAKNERQHAIFRPDEPEKITRAKTVPRFVGHCALNLSVSTIRNPKGTWDSRGILEAWARNPLLLAMLPIHFAGHTAGTDFIDMLDVAKIHEYVIAAGGTDPLTAEKQYAAINIIHPGSVDHRINPKHGHISYPLAISELLDTLDRDKQAPVAQPAESPIKSGLHLVSSATEQALGLTAKTFGLAGRIGGKALSSIWPQNELSEAA